MAVFLVNQCTFSKLSNINNDHHHHHHHHQQQHTTTNTTTTTTLTSNGGGGSCCQSNHNSNDSTSNLSSNSAGVGLAPSNICGLKFDSLFELIHHIEDNHITDVDYTGITGPFYNGHPQAQQQPTHHTSLGPSPHGHVVSAPTIRDSNIYNVIPHDRHHMTQIINGGWLPTSCILRIFNSTHKPHKLQQQQQQQQHQLQQLVQPPIHQLMHKLQAPQHHLQAMQPQQQQQQQQPPPPQLQQQQSPQPPPPQIKYETGVVLSQSQDSQQQTNVITAPLGATHMVQPQMAAIVQPQIQTQQGMHPQQMIVQLAQAPMQPMQVQQQPQPTQIIPNQPQLVTQTISNSIQTQQQQTVAQANVVASVTTVTKPTKFLKCTECNKTYKTAHGLRHHHSSHHPNSPYTEGKIIAMMPEGGDTSSGSPAPIYQQQQQQPQHQQQSQPMMIDMVQQQQQQQQPMMVEMVQQQLVQQQTQPMSIDMVPKQQPKPTQIINNSPQPSHTTINSIQSQSGSTTATAVAPITNTPKPVTKVVYKCTDCNKTYKTVAGLNTHQKTHHSNSPKTDGKTNAIIPEGGDTSSGSPAPISQQQPLSQAPQQLTQQPLTPQPQQPSQQQPMTVNMVIP